MQKTINVLIIENEALIVKVLKSAFLCLDNLERRFHLSITDSCENAKTKIQENSSIDLALININIPPCEDNKVLFIEDLSLKLRASFPHVKIIIFSSFKNNIKINSLLKTLNPESLLVKSDICYDELLRAIETVIVEPPYYSKTILRYLRRHITQDIVLDHFDKSILYYLSKGAKTKDLPKLVHLSRAAIERRKRILKGVFGIVKNGDGTLIQKAENYGFI